MHMLRTLRDQLTDGKYTNALLTWYLHWLLVTFSFQEKHILLPTRLCALLRTKLTIQLFPTSILWICKCVFYCCQEYLNWIVSKIDRWKSRNKRRKFARRCGYTDIVNVRYTISLYFSILIVYQMKSVQSNVRIKERKQKLKILAWLWYLPSNKKEGINKI